MSVSQKFPIVDVEYVKKILEQNSTNSSKAEKITEYVQKMLNSKKTLINPHRVVSLLCCFGISTVFSAYFIFMFTYPGTPIYLENGLRLLTVAAVISLIPTTIFSAGMFSNNYRWY